MRKSYIYLLMGLLWIIIGFKQWTPENKHYTILYVTVGILFLLYGIIHNKKEQNNKYNH